MAAKEVEAASFLVAMHIRRIFPRASISRLHYLRNETNIDKAFLFYVKYFKNNLALLYSRLNVYRNMVIAFTIANKKNLQNF